MASPKALPEPEPEPISPVSAYAAGIRAEAADITEGREGLHRTGAQFCRTCQRWRMNLEDGECDQCRGVTGDDLVCRQHRARRQGELNAAKALRLLASDRGIDRDFAAFLLQRADAAERRARR